MSLFRRLTLVFSACGLFLAAGWLFISPVWAVRGGMQEIELNA